MTGGPWTVRALDPIEPDSIEPDSIEPDLTEPDSTEASKNDSRDLERWIEMRLDLHDDEDPAETADEARRLASNMTLHGRPMLVALAHDQDAPVGFIEIAQRDVAEGCVSSPVAYVEAWYVAPDHRGRGVGAALMRHATDWARAHGHTELASDAWAHNIDSARAHAALGFEDMGVIRCFRRPLS